MKKLLLLTVFAFAINGVFAQGVAINETGNEPHPSSMLDISSDDKGLLIPRLTEEERNAINNPAYGLIIFQINNDAGLYINKSILGVNWERITQSSLIHNEGTGNTFVGVETAIALTSGSENTTLGYQAGKSINSGHDNTFVGFRAGTSLTEASYNTFIGNDAGRLNTSGEYNSFLGFNAGYNNTTGNSNTYIGYYAGQNSNGIRNTFIGRNAGRENTGNENLIAGYSAGLNETGNNNVYLGTHAGYSNTSGYNNVFIGYKAGYYENGSKKLYIDNSNTSTPLIYGDFDTDILTINGNLGIGTTLPEGKLDIDNGGIYLSEITDPSTPSSGKGAIYAKSNGHLFYKNDAGETHDLTLSGSGNQTLFEVYRQSGNTVMMSPAYGDIRFYNQSDKEILFLDESSGNIGIGTTSPEVALQLSDNNDVTLSLTADDDNSNEDDNPRIELTQDGGNVIGGLGYEGASGSLYAGSHDNSMYLINEYNSSMHFGTNDSLHLTITNDGKLGIGTNNPASKLDVNGDINISSGNSIKINENTILHNRGDYNVFVGQNSGENLTTGNYNTTLGFSALFNNTSGYKNVASGFNALYNNTSGGHNSAFGGDCLGINTTGSYNTAYGYAALYHNINGSENTAVGSFAGYAGLSHCDISENTILGYEAGLNLSNGGDNNILIGHRAGQNLMYGANNIIIGYNVDAYSVSTTNELNIANAIRGNINTGNIGIGTYATTNDKLTIGGVLYVMEGIKTDKWLYDNSNTFIGMEVAGAGNLGPGNLYNTAIGNKSLFNITSGNFNTALGFSSLFNNTTGKRNVASGVNAMFNNTSGNNNSAYGADCLSTNTTGSDNTAYGYAALYHNMNGSENTVIGNWAGYANISHCDISRNTILGYKAGYQLSNGGDNNILIGHNAGQNIMGGANNIIIGYGVDAQGMTSSHELNIGNAIYGDLNTGRIGIGTTNPNEMLEIANSASRGRMVVSDGGGSTRYGLMLESPNSSFEVSRIESYHYGTGGVNLEINTTGNGTIILGGDAVPQTHKSENLGSDERAWNNIYYDDLINQGAAAFTDRNVTEEILAYPPRAKTEGMFDYKTDKGLEELDPNSLPTDLKEGLAILTDEMVTYNYKANFEQQTQINSLKLKNQELMKIIGELTKRIETLEK